METVSIITCPVESPCATFLKTVTAEVCLGIGGTLEGIDMSTVVAKLDVLDVPNGGFQWMGDSVVTASRQTKYSLKMLLSKEMFSVMTLLTLT